MSTQSSAPTQSSTSSKATSSWPVVTLGWFCWLVLRPYVLRYVVQPSRPVRRGLAQALTLLLLSQTTVVPLAASVWADTPEERARKSAESARLEREKPPAVYPSVKRVRQQELLSSQSGLALQQITTTFNGLTGLAFHEAQQKLLAAVNAPSGQPRNFALLDAAGAQSAYGNVNNLGGELRLATARDDDGNGQSVAGFARGELFFNTAAPGVIARLSASGVTLQNPWVTLGGANALTTGRVTGLTLDRTGGWQGHVLAVTASGRIYRVTATGQATLVANLNTPLSGVAVLPNNVAQYGPWAGRVVVGAPQQGLVYAVNAQGQSVSQGFGLNPAELLLV